MGWEEEETNGQAISEIWVDVLRVPMRPAAFISTIIRILRFGRVVPG
jgi:hypothetical protein